MPAAQAVVGPQMAPCDWRGAMVTYSPINDLSEDVARRMRKRHAAVAFVKLSTTYAVAKQNRSSDVDLLQPDACDITMSKRAWEKAFRNWRVSLRAMAGEESSLDGL